MFLQHTANSRGHNRRRAKHETDNIKKTPLLHRTKKYNTYRKKRNQNKDIEYAAAREHSKSSHYKRVTYVQNWQLRTDTRKHSAETNHKRPSHHTTDNIHTTLTKHSRNLTILQRLQTTVTEKGQQTLSEINMCHNNSPHFLEKYSGLGYINRPKTSQFLLPFAFVLIRRSPEYDREHPWLYYSVLQACNRTHSFAEKPWATDHWTHAASNIAERMPSVRLVHEGWPMVIASWTSHIKNRIWCLD
jgi:hypothetical protein